MSYSCIVGITIYSLKKNIKENKYKIDGAVEWYTTWNPQWILDNQIYSDLERMTSSNDLSITDFTGSASGQVCPSTWVQGCGLGLSPWQSEHINK